VRIFNWIKDKVPPELGDLIGTLSFAGKKDCPLLAAPDFLAYSANMHEVNLLNLSNSAEQWLLAMN